MKKNLPIFLAAFIILAIFTFFSIASEFKLVLALPAFDPVTVPNINAFSDWITRSIVTISIFLNVFQWLKVKAIKSPGTVDDKVLTYLFNFFSLQWFKDITSKNDNP